MFPIMGSIVFVCTRSKENEETQGVLEVVAAIRTSLRWPHGYQKGPRPSLSFLLLWVLSANHKFYLLQPLPRTIVPQTGRMRYFLKSWGFCYIQQKPQYSKRSPITHAQIGRWASLVHFRIPAWLWFPGISPVGPAFGFSKNKSCDGGSSGSRGEGFGGAWGGDHLPRLSGALPRPQDPPLPPLLLQWVRPTTGPSSKGQPPICVPRLPKGNSFASKWPQSTSHGFFCQPNERTAYKNRESARENGSRLRNVF